MGKTLQTNIAIGGIVNPSLQKAFAMVAQYASKASNNISKVNSRSIALAQSANTHIDDIAGKLKSALVTGAITAAGVKVGKTMLDQAASLEQYRNTLNIVMKDNTKAAETFAWATDYANRTPFETGEIVEATVKLTSYGLEAKKVLPLTGDMASAMGKSIDQATEAIADAQTGELERLKEFGITKDMIVAQGAKTLSGIEIVNNKGQITNQKAFNTAMFSLMKERYAGAMEIQSKSFKGLMSTIVGVSKSGLARIAGINKSGEIISGSPFDIVKQKISGVADLLTKIQDNGTIDKIADRFAVFFQIASSGIDFIWSKVSWLFSYFAKKNTISENLNGLIPVLAGVVSGFLAFAAITKVIRIFNTLKGVIGGFSLLANPIVLIAIAIGLFVAGCIYAYKHSERFREIVNQLWGKFKEFGAYLADKIPPIIEQVGQFFSDKLLPVLEDLGNWILDNVIPTLSKFGDFFMNSILPILKQFGDFIVNYILPAISKFGEFFVNTIIPNLESVGSKVLELWNNQLLPFFSWLASILGPILNVVLPAIGRVFNDLLSSIGGVINGMITTFGGIIDFVTGIFTGNWSLAWQGVQDIFAGIFEQLGSLIKTPLNTVIGLINAAISSINSSIQIDIPEWVPDYGGQHFGLSIPLIPMLAKGGITNIPSICGEAGPESVIPLKRNNPRSISLLEKTATAIGYKGNQGGEGHNFIFAPQISGNADAETIKQLKQSFEEFKEMVLNSLADEKRECYGS